MVEPEKPFACTMPDCGMTFTNEDHLNVHTKKHDMVLQFGGEQKAAFVADQTPTPTRFIRNCEEVGLFQDLQNVNPFDEGFKRAIETKQGILSLEHVCTPSSEELHTPQMFPLLDSGDSVFTTNNQRNITISRSSSDETGAIKEFETTRISKLTNEVTTISRIVEKLDDTPKTKDSLKNSVSYTNNVIKIHSNVEIINNTDRTKDAKDASRKDGGFAKDAMFKDGVIVKDGYDRLQVDVPPIMSQKSIDFVVDSFTADYTAEKTIKDGTCKDGVSIKDRCKDGKSIKDDATNKTDEKGKDYEVILKLPSGQQIKLITADEAKERPKNTKDLLKKVLTEKVESQKINNVNLIPSVPSISSGTLIPVSVINTSLVNSAIVNYLPKLPLKVFDKKGIKRKASEHNETEHMENGKRSINSECRPNMSHNMESRSAASRRYRARLKETMTKRALENKQLKELNDRLVAEKAALKTVIIQHMRRCHSADDIRELQEKIDIIERTEKL